jgi:hypothetical protein
MSTRTLMVHDLGFRDLEDGSAQILKRDKMQVEGLGFEGLGFRDLEDGSAQILKRDKLQIIL